MKVVIADGFHEADYIISLFKNRKNDLVVINESEDICKYLSLNNNIPIMKGRCTRESDLREAGCENCDLFIALSEDDYRNYVACKTAKMLIGAKRCVATVINPKNVAIFKQLGIDSVVSSTYLMGQLIHNVTSVDNLINALSIEDAKVFIGELLVSSDYAIVNQSLREINISEIATVASIIRDGMVIIPNGRTIIQDGDKILIVSSEDNRDQVLSFLQRKK